MKILGYANAGKAFSEVDFNTLRWQSWGTAQSTAIARAYFTGPGEYDDVTLIAFDLGPCDGTYAYQRMEWLASGQNFDPNSYFDACSGRGVGQGWP